MGFIGNIKRLIANRYNYGKRRSLSDIKYIVYHYTANDGDSDEGNAKYFRNNKIEASAHYFVDSDSITQSVPDYYVAYSVGGNKYPSCAVTGGGERYGWCTNANSINIELCDDVKNGKFDFTEAELELAANLGRELMAKYNVPIQNVIRHFDVNGKICPEPFVRNPAAWRRFKERLVDDEVVTKEKIVVDGKEYTIEAIRKDGTVYPKLRDLADLLGCEVGNKGKTPVIKKMLH